MVEPSEPRRRWFRFSLRTLLVGVALLSIAVGGYYIRERRIVRERHALNREPGISYWLNGAPHENPSLLRDILGDEPVHEVKVAKGVSPEVLARILATFQDDATITIE